MLTITFIYILTSAIGFTLGGFLFARKKHLIVALAIFSFSFSCLAFAVNNHEKYCQIKEMQRRLNEPICYLDQLYGYKILDKRYAAEKPSFEKPATTDYFIDLEDLLPNGGIILRNVKVSEKIYNDPATEKGKEFLQ